MPFVRTDILRSIAAPILWSAYVAIPVDGWGWLDGVPLDRVEAGALALVWWSWAVSRRLPGALVLVALVIAKVALAGIFVERGFVARYYANDGWAAPVERSTEFRDRPYTRRDERLAFGEAGQDLPLYFFNHQRFNFYRPGEPDRGRLGYSVAWDGVLLVEDDRRAATFYISAAESASGGLWVDGRPVIVLDRASPRTGSAVLDPGWHALRLSVAAPQGADRRFEAGEIAGDTRRPLDGSRIFPAVAGPARLAIDTTARRATSGLDAAVLLWLVVLVAVRVRRAVRERKIGSVLWLGAVLEAVRYAWPYDSHLTVIRGDSDMLTYEHFSRVILLGDPLLAAPGPAVGQGASFAHQPLYPYLLALAHLVFGEDLFGIVLVQRLLVAATATWAAMTATWLFGVRTGWVAGIGGGLFLYQKLGAWSNVLLGEPLFAPMLTAWVWLLSRLATEPLARPRLLLAGVVGGLSTLTRSTLLLAWPVIIPLWSAALPRRRVRATALLVLVMATVVGTATLRNWIVAERFVLVTTVGGPLINGNLPPRPLAPTPAGRAALYDQLRINGEARVVAEYAVQMPVDFAAHLGRKAMYTVGLYDLSGLGAAVASDRAGGTAWSYLGMWILAGVGIWRIRQQATAHRGPVLWLALALALCHFAAVVLMFPWFYGDRIIMPLYPLLIPYAAVAVVPLTRWVEPYARAVGGALQSGARRVWHPSARQGLIVLRAALHEPRSWAYLAYTAAALHWQSGVALVATLLLPATAWAATRLTRHRRAHQLVGHLLWSAALAVVAAGGSRSAEALHDPLFWGLVSVVALVGSAVTRRWPVLIAATAAVAGACTMTATMLPLFSDFESDFPVLVATTIGASSADLARQLGPAGALCLLAVWLQAIFVAGTRDVRTSRIVAGARGALVAGLFLTCAGRVPRTAVETAASMAALGILLGLVEAQAGRNRPAGESSPAAPTVRRASAASR